MMKWKDAGVLLSREPAHAKKGSQVLFPYTVVYDMKLLGQAVYMASAFYLLLAAHCQQLTVSHA